MIAPPYRPKVYYSPLDKVWIADVYTGADEWTEKEFDTWREAWDYTVHYADWTLQDLLTDSW